MISLGQAAKNHEVFNQAVVSLNSLMTKEVEWKVQNPS